MLIPSQSCDILFFFFLQIKAEGFNRTSLLTHHQEITTRERSRSQICLGPTEFYPQKMWMGYSACHSWATIIIPSFLSKKIFPGLQLPPSLSEARNSCHKMNSNPTVSQLTQHLLSIALLTTLFTPSRYPFPLLSPWQLPPGIYHHLQRFCSPKKWFVKSFFISSFPFGLLSTLGKTEAHRNTASLSGPPPYFLLIIPSPPPTPILPAPT